MDQTVVIIYHKKTVFEEQNKCKTFSVLITKNVKKIDKNKEKMKKPYLTNSNLLIAQYLWQVHYKILLIILLREFVKLNAPVAISFIFYSDSV